ncbi:MAG TPA: hypothetical protein DD639_02255, partial [Acinetobacter sp.]|nr:hypothetical protein [Acinetobacter sp.]
YPRFGLCSYFSEVSDQDDKYKDRAKAIVNVIEEDNITMTYIAKNRLGDILLEHKQVLSQCPEFINLKQSIS